MTLLLLDCPLDGDKSDRLGLDLVHLRHHFANHLVHLGLVVHIQLGKGEEGNPAENNQGEGVEPGTKVCQEPEGEAKLDGVHHGLDQEESPQFEDSGVDGVSKARGGGGDGVGRDGQGELSDLSIKLVDMSMCTVDNKQSAVGNLIAPWQEDLTQPLLCQP